MRALLLAVLALAGCYTPHFPDCAVACASVADCAPAQECGADGWCASPANAGRCAAILDNVADGATRLDAAVMDAAVSDARTAIDARIASDAPADGPGPAGCAPGCNGICASGVCVITCIAPGACAAPVVCPATGPCWVVCTGFDSCRGGVTCGTGPCAVACSGRDACHHRVRCKESCACEVSCDGDGACDEDAECPARACEDEGGCTAASAACDAC